MAKLTDAQRNLMKLIHRSPDAEYCTNCDEGVSHWKRVSSMLVPTVTNIQKDIPKLIDIMYADDTKHVRLTSTGLAILEYL